MNKGLIYQALKARITAQDSTARIKFIGKQNRQLERLKDGKALSFRLPAVLIGFRSPGNVMDVGGGVQVWEGMVEVEILHEFYNDSATGTSINLDVYDVEKAVHGWLQGYAVRGADYGCSELTRMEEEEDEEHDQVYSKKISYATTFVDNSTKYPSGGYEINPPLDADITAEVLEADVPSVIASVSSLDFGSVAIGATATRTFTIQGSNLGSDPIIISTTNGIFTITTNTIYKTRIAMSPEDGEVAETTVTVKYSPTTGGASSGSILYGIPGVNGEITLSGSAISYLLKEDGDFLLKEDGDKLLL